MKIVNIDKALKIARKIDDIFSKIAMLICLLLFSLSSYSLIDTLLVYNEAQDKSLLKYKPGVGNEMAYIEIKDAVAWLTLTDTPIDYPIMQGKDNNEYLNKNPIGEFSLSGSIFIDSRNDSHLTDDYILVYGHHMEHDAMFGALDHYKDKDYFDKHRSGVLTVDGKQKDVKIFAVINCIASDSHIFSPYNFDLEYLKENASIYEEPLPVEQFIAFTTCAATPSEARLAVIATVSKGE